jgi:protein-S-isoprenylcysteine O-methyltransferase Ste14
MTTAQLSILALLWFAYGALHSLLATLELQRRFAARWPNWRPLYRLFYNGVAIILLLPPVLLTFAWRGPLLWEWRGIGAWLADLLALAAGLGFLWTLRYYDLQAFLGLRQWRQGSQAGMAQEPFYLSPMHRYVRHPWYFFSLVILWTRAMDPALLLASAMITLYFVLGSRLEEGKLIVYYGDVYRRYRERVPALLPLPWRYLSQQEAAALLAGATQSRSHSHDVAATPPP